MDCTTFNNGVKMPSLGFGVFQIDPQETERCVLDALDVGYRSIDTAQIYGNEQGVGDAIVKSGIARKDIFVTTKVWISNFGYERAKASIDESLTKLKTDYVDLVLLHQPYGDVYGAYRALTQAYKEGKIRAIGVSNFVPDRLADLVAFNDVVPATNQIEAHVFWQRKEDRAIASKLGSTITAWGPFAEGKNDLFNNSILTKIGKTHNKTAAQVALRFLLQLGYVVLPKSVHKSRMQSNFEVFDFVLTESEMVEIEALDQDKPLVMPCTHNSVQAVEFMTAYSKSR
jgi:diketogulonate reductase-like aldo/keto reductase